MMTPDLLLGYFTGLRFLNPDIAWPTLVRTALFVHLLDALMCRLVAHNNGHPKTLWSALGLVFGIWAVAAILLLPARGRAPARQ
jgi:hypothetical protein